MQTIGNLKFLLFEIAIKMLSLYLMTKTAKIMTHTDCIEQVLPFVLSLHKQSGGKVPAGEE